MAAKHFVDASYLRECFDYDRETGEFRWRARPVHHFQSASTCLAWNTRFAGARAFTQRASNGYAIGRVSVDGVYFKMLAHRVAWVMETGSQPKDQIDHADRDRSNNRFVNLREASQAQNNWNAKDRDRDLPRGVYRNGEGYQARLAENRGRRSLGTFGTPEEAEKVWQNAVRNVRSSFVETPRV